MTALKPPFPYFGGKRAIADVIWEALGDPGVFIDPFMGSNAVLLLRPSVPKVETCNDRDGFVVNAYRAIQTAPEETASHAVCPVHELTLHAIHRWLMARDADLVEKLRADPDYYDPLIAGRWLAGISMWIGGNWCSQPSQKIPHIRGRGYGAGGHQQLLMVTGNTPGRGVHKRRPHLLHHGMGIYQKRPMVAADRPGNDVLQGGARRTQVQGDRYANEVSGRDDLQAWFHALSARLRRVRICCGDWRRVLTPTVLDGAGYTGIILDPPYSHSERDNRLYAHDRDIAADVAAWAREHGTNPKLRIVLCGYDTEHDMPGWTQIQYRVNGGYANQRKNGTNRNKYRETLWLSPHCNTVTHQLTLFAPGDTYYA